MLIVLSLFIAGVTLAGYAATSGRASDGPWLERAALGAAAGVLIDYFLVLCGLRLTYVLAAVGLLGAWGLVKAARDWRSARGSRCGGARRAAAWAVPVLIAYIVGLYYVVVLAEPIGEWDPRAIWFFHAKMIWLEGALRRHAGFTHPSLAFSHADYPNLVPAIAAQLAWGRGFWNEVLPKASLVVMLVPPILWAFTFRRLGALALLVPLAFFSLDGWLTRGLMDPYLALYLGMALMLFGRYAREGKPADLLSVVCALGIVSSLKNEGMVLVMSFAVALVAVSLFTSRRMVSEAISRLAHDSSFLRVALLAAAPTVIWAGLTRMWGLHNDLTASLSVNATRLAKRVSDGSAAYLFHYLVTRATALWLIAGLFLVAVALLLVLRRRVPRAAVTAALTSVIYFSAVYVVYLATPYDLGWHLTTSATRTMFPTTVALVVALYLVVSEGTGIASPTAAVAKTRGNPE